MKNLFIIIILIIGTTACENQDQDFPDFNYKTVYFPLQLPLRTLSLGEDRVDNQLDMEHKFDIAVSIGGMYENTQNWTVDYVVDPSLTDSAYNADGEKLIALPSNYYTLSPPNTVEIPEGSFNGMIRVELTNEFFNDPLALTGNYVIPLLITDTSADSILSGLQAAPGEADRRIISDWESGMAPKDWILFGIKYVNAYEGNYLQRGMNISYLGTTPIDTVVYNEQDVERDLLIELKSIDLNSVTTNKISTKISKVGKYSMELEFGDNKGASCSVTIKPVSTSNYAVSGTGEYFDLSSSIESWIGLNWQSMYLKYTYNDGTNDHQVSDTLVFRDRGINFELNSLVIRK